MTTSSLIRNTRAALRHEARERKVRIQTVTIVIAALILGIVQVALTVYPHL